MESKAAVGSATGGTGRACLAFFAAIFMGCGASPEPAPAAFSPPLEPWTGPLHALFDDSIEPTAVGLALDGQPPTEDPLLQARTRSAELVARMRVNTVTVDVVGAKATYTLNLQVGQPPLVPAVLHDRSIEIAIRPGAPAHGIAASLGTRLQGRTFIGFVRRFAGETGPELHWFLTADSPAVAKVISETSMLDEMAAP